MCAKDRSQNSVCSQTEFIQYLDDVFSISSSLSLIRDSQGELGKVRISRSFLPKLTR